MSDAFSEFKNIGQENEGEIDGVHLSYQAVTKAQPMTLMTLMHLYPTMYM